MRHIVHVIIGVVIGAQPLMAQTGPGRGHYGVACDSFAPLNSEVLGADPCDNNAAPHSPDAGWGNVERRPMSRVRLIGRHGLQDDAGRLVPAQSVTSFQLVDFIAHQRQLEAGRLLDSIRPANFVRVLVMAAHLFVLSPSDGIAALPATLDLLASKGMRAEVVALADTREWPDLDFHVHVAAVGEICATHPACAAIELGNEVEPVHTTQNPALGDVNLLLELQALIPAHIPVSLGSTHGGSDESDIFKDGRYLTVHGSRDSGENDVRWVRRTDEQRALADRVGKWVWNDEPRRDDLRCDHQLGVGLLTRMFSLGDTFHYEGGLYSLPPSGAELAAFQCRAQGWAAIPSDWRGVSANAGSEIPKAPVKSALGAVRIYSAISAANPSRAYTLVLGADPDMTPEWNEEWPHRTLKIHEGDTQLWEVSK